MRKLTFNDAYFRQAEGMSHKLEEIFSGDSNSNNNMRAQQNQNLNEKHLMKINGIDMDLTDLQ